MSCPPLSRAGQKLHGIFYLFPKNRLCFVSLTLPLSSRVYAISPPSPPYVPSAALDFFRENRVLRLDWPHALKWDRVNGRARHGPFFSQRQLSDLSPCKRFFFSWALGFSDAWFSFPRGRCLRCLCCFPLKRLSVWVSPLLHSPPHGLLWRLCPVFSPPLRVLPFSLAKTF